MEIFHFNRGIQMKSKDTIVIFTIALLFLICPILKAQEDNKPVEIKSLTKIKLTFFGAGIEREQKISPLNSVYAGASYQAIFLFEPVYLGNGRAPDIPSFDSLLGLTPVFYTGFRKYTDLNERKSKNKKTRNNSGNYFGMELDAFASIKSNNGKYKTSFAMSFAPQWGMQRSLTPKANFEFALGPAIKTNFEAAKLLLFGRLGFSFLL